MTNNSDEYGTQAAAAIAARLADMRAAEAALEAGAESARVGAETYADADSVREAVSRMALEVTLDIIGAPLSALVGSAVDAAEAAQRVEAHALLAWGGPAVRISSPAIICAGGGVEIAGDDTPWLEAQGWGTPWQSAPLSDAEAEAVEWAARIILG